MLAVLLGPALGLPGKRGPLHGPDGKVLGPTLDKSLQPDPPSKMATPPSPKAQADPNDPKAQAGAAEPPALWDSLSKEFDKQEQALQQEGKLVNEAWKELQGAASSRGPFFSLDVC